MRVTVEKPFYGNGAKEYGSILEALVGERVFSVGVTSDGEFLFEEECDRHFSLLLTPDQVTGLVDELRDLVIKVNPA